MKKEINISLKLIPVYAIILILAALSIYNSINISIYNINSICQAKSELLLRDIQRSLNKNKTNESIESLALIHEKDSVLNSIIENQLNILSNKYSCALAIIATRTNQDTEVLFVSKKPEIVNKNKILDAFSTNKEIKKIKHDDKRYYACTYRLDQHESGSYYIISIFPENYTIHNILAKGETQSLLAISIAILTIFAVFLWFKGYSNKLNDRLAKSERLLDDYKSSHKNNILKASAIESSGFPLLFLDSKGKIIHRNALANSLFEIDFLVDIVVDSDKHLLREIFSGNHKRDYVEEISLNVIGKNQKKRTCELGITSFHTENLDGYIVIIRDISNKVHERQLFTSALNSLETRVHERTNELKKSEKYLKTLIDILPFNFWAKNIDGEYSMQNSISVKQWGNLIDNDSRARCDKKLISEISNAESQAYQGVASRKEIQYQELGESKASDLMVLPVYVDSNLTGIVGVLIDITDQKQAELKERESQRMLKTVLDNIPAYVYWKDTNLVYLGCNNNQAKAAGADNPDELIGKNDYDLSWTKIEAETIRRSDEIVIDSGQARFNIIEHQTNANGQLMWTETNKIPLRNDEGEIIGILGTYEDITQRKNAEEKLRILNEDLESRVSARTQELEKANDKLHSEIHERMEAEKALRLSEEKYRIIVENQSDLTINIDSDCNINFASTSFCLTFSKRKEILLGDSLLKYFNEEHQVKFIEFINKISKSSDGGRIEILAKTQTEWRWFEWIAAPVLDNWGKVSSLLCVGRDINERKVAEDKIKFLSRITEQVTDAVVATDLNFKINYINKACEELYGYTLQDLQGKHSDILLVRTMSDDLREKVLHRIQVGGKYYIELQNRKRFGKEFTCSMQFTAIVDDAKNPIAYVSIRQDITEKKAHLERIRKSESRLKLVLEGTDDGFWDWDLTNDEFSLSVRAMEMLGFDTYDLKHHHSDWAKLIHPEDSEMVMIELMKHMAHNTTQYQTEHRKMKKSGEYIWVLERGKIVDWDEHGSPLRMTGSLTDITSGMQARQALKSSEELYKTTIDNLDESILLVDKKMNIKLFNKAFEKWTAMFDSELSLKKGAKVFQKLLKLPDLIWKPDEYKKLFEHPQLLIEEQEHKVKFKRIHSEIRRIPVMDNGKTQQIVTVIRDITEKKVFEKEREKLLTQLLETNEALEDLNAELQKSNNDLEEFAYVASHDLQEPLRMIASYVQLLARRYSGQLSSEADEFIKYSVEGAQRMQKLISDLLKWSRLGTKGQEFIETDFEDILSKVMANLRIAIKESGANITFDDLPVISIDQTQMGQLLQNLIGNAIKYRDKEIPQIHISVEIVDDKYEFRVSDNGIGIDPRYADRIFIIFQRLHTRNHYSGTGIGLALCKKIVERHGGKIWLEPNNPKGSVFCFTIPLQPKLRESFNNDKQAIFKDPAA